MPGYDLVIDLVGLVKEYEAKKADHQRLVLSDFAQWLSSKHVSPLSQIEQPLEWKLFELLGLMARFSNIYLKEAFTASPLSSIRDFGLMAILQQQGSMTMIALIKEAMMEKPTGMEVIKRLIKQGMIATMPNPEDKRSKLIKLTDEGAEVLAATYPTLGSVAHVVRGNLTKEEQITFIRLLEKLSQHHLQQLSLKQN